MRTAIGIFLGILICLCGGLVTASLIDIALPRASTLPWVSAFAFPLANFLGGLLLARFAGVGAYIYAGFVAIVQAFFGLGLFASAVAWGMHNRVGIFVAVWIATTFAAIAFYLWRTDRAVAHK